MGLQCEDKGEQPIVFLHGLFGKPANWDAVIDQIGRRHRCVAVELPIGISAVHRNQALFEMKDLVGYVAQVVEELSVESIVLVGNSFGGQIAIGYALNHPGKVKQLVLTGSAGLDENAIGGRTDIRGSRDLIRERLSNVFCASDYDVEPLVDGVYEALNDREYLMHALKIARVCRSWRVDDELCLLELPTLIVWGMQDAITPLKVANQFHDSIKNSVLTFVDNCGHVPPMERPREFTDILIRFLGGSQ